MVAVATVVELAPAGACDFLSPSIEKLSFATAECKQYILWNCPATKASTEGNEMSRREILKSAGALAAISTLGFGRPAFAADPTMTTVCKIVGVPYFSLLETGLVAAGKKTGIRSNMIGPAQVDPAQQVRLIEDVIAKKVDVLGLIPLDVKVLAPVVQRARDAGIIVITQEGPDMEGRTWDVEMVDSKKFGEEMMKSLARQMGGKGDYIVIVGTLTTPLHNLYPGPGCSRTEGLRAQPACGPIAARCQCARSSPARLPGALRHRACAPGAWRAAPRRRTPSQDSN